MAAGGLRSRHQREVFLEAVHLRLEGGGQGRSFNRFTRHRRQRQGAAHGGGIGEQENVPRGQFSVSTKADDRVAASRSGSGASFPVHGSERWLECPRLTTASRASGRR